jgi:hypothetical protein
LYLTVSVVPSLPWGITPIGISFLSRDGRAIKPHLMAKGGLLVFAQKAESPNARYENIGLRSELGLQIRLGRRTELHLGMGDPPHLECLRGAVQSRAGMTSYMFGITPHFGPRDRRSH